MLHVHLSAQGVRQGAVHTAQHSTHYPPPADHTLFGMEDVDYDQGHDDILPP